MTEVRAVIAFQDRGSLGRDERGPSGSVLLLELVGGGRAAGDNSLSSYCVCVRTFLCAYRTS